MPHGAGRIKRYRPTRHVPYNNRIRAFGQNSKTSHTKRQLLRITIRGQNGQPWPYTHKNAVGFIVI